MDEDKLDGRLSADEIVSIVEAGETGHSALAFPLGVIGDSAANADVGGEPIVVFTASEDRSVGVFSRTLDGDILTFDHKDDDIFTDRETTSRWDFAGRAVSGPLTGARLQRMNSRRAFWFSVAISFSGIEIHNLPYLQSFISSSA